MFCHEAKSISHAAWIWSPGRVKHPFQAAYFRSSFCVHGKATRGIVKCAADSRYRLWVNGEYIGFGPARGSPSRPYFDRHKIDLRSGRNTVALLVLHYTEPLPIFAPVRGGVICQVESESGGKILAATGAHWRCLDSEAYSALPGLLFPECWDARLEPEGWQETGFDDAGWVNAVGVGDELLCPPNELQPRPIPLIREMRIVPSRILTSGSCPAASGNGAHLADELAGLDLSPTGNAAVTPVLLPHMPWPAKGFGVRLDRGRAFAAVLDFGAETLAFPEISVEGPPGILVDFGYSECLDNNRVATRWQGLRQSERIVLRDGLTKHRFNQPRGFRYMLLRMTNRTDSPAAVRIRDVSAHEAIYPCDFRGSFSCSDSLLNDIYETSLRTLNLCMEDAFTDCPWRERSQYIGDFQIESLATYYSQGVCALADKAVAEFAQGSTREGWVPAIFPARNPINVPTWGMRLPIIFWEHYLFSGNAEMLARSYPAVRRQMRWLSQYARKNGLLEKLPGWAFVDWTPLDAQNANDAVIQGWYLQALETSAMIAGAVGERADAAVYASTARRLRRTLAEAFWDEKRGAFRRFLDGSSHRPATAPEDLVGQHENFLFVLLGIGTARQRDRALNAIAGVTGRYMPNVGDYQSRYLGQWNSGELSVEDVLRYGDRAQAGNYTTEKLIRIGSPFWSYYALQGLMASGKTASALEYIRLFWGMMLEFGATAWWEMWDRHSSHCHGWSTGPAIILPAYVLGIRPRKPGFVEFDFSPQLGDLEWAEGVVPTPHGRIRAKLRCRGDHLEALIEIPPKTKARFKPPMGFYLSGAFATKKMVWLAQGRHRIVAERRNRHRGRNATYDNRAQSVKRATVTTTTAGS